MSSHTRTGFNPFTIMKDHSVFNDIVSGLVDYLLPFYGLLLFIASAFGICQVWLEGIYFYTLFATGNCCIMAILTFCTFLIVVIGEGGEGPCEDKHVRRLELGSYTALVFAFFAFVAWVSFSSIYGYEVYLEKSPDWAYKVVCFWLWLALQVVSFVLKALAGEKREQTDSG